MTFDLYSYRLLFEAREAISFPAGAPGNILRGALGGALRRIACAPKCPGFHRKAARECEFRTNCAYAKIFEPASMDPGPSGLSDWPRPFVIRAACLDGRTVAPGELFSFHLNLFDTQHPLRDWLAGAFKELARQGFGPGRGRAELVAFEQVGRDGRHTSGPPISLPLEPPSSTLRRLRITFQTPTELKTDGKTRARPDFGVLFARARDRVSTLRSLYGSGPLAIDFHSLGEQATAVRMTACRLEHVPGQRRSSRTGLTHGLGGFIGSADYEGELAEFVPFLEAAQWTGVGRHCVWGNGELRIEPGNHL